MISNGLLNNNSNIEKLQQTNAVLASMNNDTMQQLQQITAQLSTMQTNNNPPPRRSTC